MPGRFRREAAINDLRDAARRRGKFGGDGPDGNARGAIRREAVNTGRDSRESDRGEPMLGGKFERRAIAGCQQLLFVVAAAASHRPDGVDHMLGRQPIAACDFHGSGVTAAERPARGEQFRSGGAMDRAVDAAAAEQGAVGRIDDGVERQRRDVGHADIEPGGADFGG